MTSQTEHKNYRPINIEFLAKGSGDSFDIFLESDSGTFVKFASTDPRHQDKVLRLLEEGDFEQEFFIKEEDLFKYYQYATKSLRSVMNDPKVPVETKTRKVYEVSKGVMKEFFSYNASSKILESSEEVMEMMEDCLSTADVGFAGISKLTSKDYYTHTHSVNVGLYCMTFGTKVGLPKDDVKQLVLGGMLHDVGKSKIDSALINKNGKLNDEEFEKMKSHSPLGEQMLRGMCCYKDIVLSMAGQHHEQFKGGGTRKAFRGTKYPCMPEYAKLWMFTMPFQQEGRIKKH
ncbi:MAG: HD domain-containing protein [Nitrospinota bacterium]